MNVITENSVDFDVPPGLVAMLLESLTPVDQKVLQDLDPAVARAHATDLLKRLGIAAEITSPSAGADLIYGLLAGNPPAERMLAGIDAILEFGVLPESLSEAERAKAARSEIRQEVLHFDRIMDLESLTEGRVALKARRDMVYDGGLLGAVERLLVLVHERLALAGSRRMQWQDLTALPQTLVEKTGRGTRLRRTSFPVVAAVAAVDDDSVLTELERYLVKHPLAVGLGLLDYSIMLAADQPSSIAAAALTTLDNGQISADMWSAGSASWVLLNRDGYRQQLLDRGALDGLPAGGKKTRLATKAIDLPPNSWLVISADGGLLAGCAELEAELNEPTRSGRIDLAANLTRLLGDHPYTVAKAGDAQALPAPRAEDNDTDLAALTEHFFNDAAGLCVSIECGHVHADREVGPAQLRGLDIGERLVGFLRSGAADQGKLLEVEVTPMVDDDHVLNRFGFSGYCELFKQRGLCADELILESSPLTRAVAHDVLRRAVQRSGDGYELVRVGDNLYLEAEHLRLELVEDVTGEMRNGCVLFEVGLVLYRAARTKITSVFWHEIETEPFDLHARMAADYDALPDPVTRQQRRSEYELLYQDPWDAVLKTSSRTPFLDAYCTTLTERADHGMRTVVVNVLEDYYRPQQEKVERLAKLLAIPLPLSAVFFSPHGRGIEIFHSEDAAG